MTLMRYDPPSDRRGHYRFAPGFSPRLVFVSTYPPTMCGLATFTASLRDAMAANRGSETGLAVVELVEDAVAGSDRPEVVARLNPADSMSIRNAAEEMSRYHMAVVQHEYGIWGPQMGSAILDLVEQLDIPVMVTLHTLLPDPTPIQQRIIEDLASRSAYVVVPTESARELLLRRYRVAPASVVVVPHGTDRIHRPVAGRGSRSEQPNTAPHLLSWGLIGPGKGLEWALEAVAILVDRFPRLRYTIAGKTHPKVLVREGEAYRHKLETMVVELSLQSNVDFLDEYLAEERIHQLLRSATVAVLPYESSEQMVSGVLVEAVSAKVPVVATAFPHAVELSTQGATAVVPHRDPEALADAIASLLESPDSVEGMIEAQRRLSDELDWANVAARYEALARDAVRGNLPVSHVPTAS